MAAAHTGSAEERFVNEMRLFHGTNPEVVEAICKQNFDWRVNGKNGTVYGQGSYFAVNSSKSDWYATEDNNRSKFMFVAKVLARILKASPVIKDHLQRIPGIPQVICTIHVWMKCPLHPFLSFFKMTSCTLST